MQAPWTLTAGPRLQWAVSDGYTARVSGPNGFVRNNPAGSVYPCPGKASGEQCAPSGGSYRYELVASRDGVEVDRRSVVLVVTSDQ